MFSEEMFAVLSDAASILSSCRLNLSTLNKYGLLVNSKLQLRENNGKVIPIHINNWMNTVYFSETFCGRDTHIHKRTFI